MVNDLSFNEWLAPRVSLNTMKSYMHWHKKLTEEQGTIWERYDLEIYLTKHRHGPARGMLVNLKEYNKSNKEIPRIKKPRSQKLPDYYSIEEVDMFLQKLESYPRQKTIVWIMAEAGLRISETLGIKYSDIKKEESRILVRGKGSAESLVIVSPRIISAINELRRIEGDIYVFQSRDKRRKGKPLTAENTRYHLHKINKEAHPHAFRHTFATSLLKGGSALITIQKALRHQDISTTARYTHVQNPEVDEAVKNLWR